MKVLFVINYYYPYISGVSETARLLAESLAKDKNYEVAVLCSNHDKLPSEEVINGVKVYRAPIIAKISKGTVSPKFIKMAKKMSKDYDIVHLQCPMLESGIISKKVDKNKLVMTYQCDVNLPKSLLNNFIVKVMDRQHKKCMKNSSSIIVSSIDYARSTRFTNDYIDKCIEIAPMFKKIKKHKRTNDGNTIGFCGRIVEEKGIDVLLKAFKIIYDKDPKKKLLIAGDYKNVAGGSIYPRLKKYIDENNIKNVTFLGKVSEEELAKFYSNIDVFVLPSVNSLEAFGLVQLEAMTCGTPVVASNLPGVRTIVKNTKMGLISEIGDEKDLADKIMKVLNDPKKYTKNINNVDKYYSNDVLTQRFIEVYKSTCKK